MRFFENLLEHEWELTPSPAGKWQWEPKEGAAEGAVPDAHDPSKNHPPMMLTTDIALKKDPEYREILERFYEHPEAFEDAFARAWSFEWLKPAADGFRNYYDTPRRATPEELLVDRAQLLTLTPPEMTGMRVLDANYDGSDHGVFTDHPGTLTNDFFANLLGKDITWEAVSDKKNISKGRARDTGEVTWTGTRVDLVFGSNAELRALAEFYGSDDAEEKFVADFTAAWNKVMNLDRFDLKGMH